MARHPHGYWTFERCREEALKFKIRGDFLKSSPSAYRISCRKGWIELFDWLGHGSNPYLGNRDCVYGYFFNDLHAVYVGRTIDKVERRRRHSTDNSSAVFQFAAEQGVPVPEMTILEDGLAVLDGCEREDFYCRKFQNEGWKLLNKGKTGRECGAIGTMRVTWNKRRCHEAAMGFKSLREFAETIPGAYQSSRKNGWLSEFDWLERRRKTVWNHEKCREEALKYRSKAEFAKCSSGAFQAASRNGWLAEYNWIPNCICKKTVLQFDSGMTIIGIFPSAHAAMRSTGVHFVKICCCCRGEQKTAGGFVWRYAEAE